jgi:hypothetical protein
MKANRIQELAEQAAKNYTETFKWEYLPDIDRNIFKKFAKLIVLECIYITYEDMTTGLMRKSEQDWEGIAVDQAMTIALMKSEQEPVAWMHTQLPDVAITHEPSDLKRHPERWTALYTSPPRKEWVGLTEEERNNALDAHPTALGVAYAIEAKLKEMNA